MSLFGDYLKETRGVEIVENDSGFATFLITGENCFVEDIFVVQGQRRSSEGTQIANQIKEIAKSRGCKWMSGTVNTSFSNPTGSMKAMLAYGFKIKSNVGNLILMELEI